MLDSSWLDGGTVESRQNFGHFSPNVSACAVARVADRDCGFAFGFVTYRFPVVSAISVERLVVFADEEVRALLADGTPA
jgi:hypothetical protein